MARSRNIKPGFFTNDDLCELEPLARLLFAGIWTIADRAGRLEDRPKKIKAEVLPYDNCDVESFLDQLACRGFILRYESSGKRFIQVLAWGKHQNPHCKESPSTIPAPDGYECQPDQKQQKHSASTVQAPCEAQPLPEQAGLIPDSLNLIPDSTTPNGVEAPQSVANKRGSRLPEDWFLPKPWGEWALEKFPAWNPEIVRAEAEKFRDHWLSESGQKARKADWFATWRKWCSSDIAQRAHSPQARASPGLTINKQEALEARNKAVAEEWLREQGVSHAGSGQGEILDIGH